MPIPEALQAVAGNRRFWTDFIWETTAEGEDYPDMNWTHVEFPITADSSLSMSLGASMGCFSLTYHGEEDTVEIAHDDQAHWHPHILRWSELDLICRAAAHHDPSLGQHPGLPLLLLHRFAPICVGDDIGWIAGMLRSAYRSVVGDESRGGFSDGEIRMMIEKLIDARDALFEWHFDEEGKFWWIGQGEEDGRTSGRECYSMRWHEGARDQFPSKEWEDTLAVAEQLLGPSQRQLPELDSASPATPATQVEMAYIPRGKHSLRLDLPLRGYQPSIRLSVTPNCLAGTIDALLKFLSVGSLAEITGSHSCQGSDGQYATKSNTMSIELYKADMDRGLQVIKEALWWATAPAGDLRLTDAQYKPLPFDLEDEIAEEYQVQGLYFQFGRVNPGDNPWMPIVTQLDPSCQESLEAFLRTEGLEALDARGHGAVTTADGGTLEFHFSDCHGTTPAVSGTLALNRLTPMTSEVVYNFIAAHSLILLPAGITASKAPEEKKGWKGHTVASASELNEIFKGGPCNWWWDRLMDSLNDKLQS